MNEYFEHVHRSHNTLQQEVLEKHKSNQDKYVLFKLSNTFQKRSENPDYFIVDVRDKWDCLNKAWDIQRLVGGGVSIVQGKMKVERTLSRLLLKVKKDPRNIQVKHLNMNPFDNTRNNLKVVSRSESLGTRKADKESVSKYIGVCPSHINKNNEIKWRVGLNFNKSSYYLGTYHKEVNGAFAYNIAKKYLYSKGCSLNSFDNGKVIGEKYLGVAVKKVRQHVEEVGFSKQAIKEITKYLVEKYSNKSLC